MSADTPKKPTTYELSETFFGEMWPKESGRFPKELLCFFASCLFELYSTYIGYLFLIDTKLNDYPWIIWSFSYLFLSVANVALSLAMCPSPRKMLGQYSKLDHISGFIVTSSISYGVWNLFARTATQQPWRGVAVAFYPFLLFTQFGNLRVNLKYQPWTIYTIGLYRIVRYSILIGVTILQVLGSVNSNASVGYFVSNFSLLAGMTAVVHFDGYCAVKSQLKKRKAEKPRDGGAHYQLM